VEENYLKAEFIIKRKTGHKDMENSQPSHVKKKTNVFRSEN
jgi:hypothetical protein